jgi:hypothetical protein
LITAAPLLGLHITISHFLFAVAKPFAIDEEIFLRLDDLLANAITEGPAPLMVTPRAPALRAFFSLY